MPKMKRNYTIDCLKGFLILCVIVGHICLGSLDENVVRYIIYSFHMPLFLFISGYLIDIEKMRCTSFSQLFSKYKQRMILPWIIAWITYSLIISIKDLSFDNFLVNLSTPFYHLWYVPSLLFFILTTWLFLKFTDTLSSLLMLVSLSLLFNSLQFSFNAFSFNYMSYYVLGVLARKTGMTIRTKNAIFWIGGGILFLFCLYSRGIMIEDYRQYLMLPFMVMICLIIVLPLIINNSLKSEILVYLGSHSLQIYLWHVLPILFFKNIDS